MDKYADRPMDFADATLVVLAEDLGSDLREDGVREDGVRSLHLHGAW
ncbi:MAG: hypothetical protein WDZ60_08080 [Wenzhouxiangellaceae bacterium]